MIHFFRPKTKTRFQFWNQNWFQFLFNFGSPFTKTYIRNQFWFTFLNQFWFQKWNLVLFQTSH